MELRWGARHDLTDRHQWGSAMSVDTRMGVGSWLPAGTLIVTATVSRL